MTYRKPCRVASSSSLMVSASIGRFVLASMNAFRDVSASRHSAVGRNGAPCRMFDRAFQSVSHACAMSMATENSGRGRCDDQRLPAALGGSSAKFVCCGFAMGFLEPEEFAIEARPGPAVGHCRRRLD